MGAVGVPVWLWVTNWGAPVSATASVGGVTVTATATATATVTSVDWQMGDGHLVHCTKPGTPYKESMGWAQSPDCGYLYQQPSTKQAGGKYQLSATANYRVVWFGAYTGTVNLTTTDSVGVTIGEYQSLIQAGTS